MPRFQVSKLQLFLTVPVRFFILDRIFLGFLKCQNLEIGKIRNVLLNQNGYSILGKCTGVSLVGGLGNPRDSTTIVQLYGLILMIFLCIIDDRHKLNKITTDILPIYR